MSNSNINNIERHEELLKIHTEESTTLVRDLKIQISEPLKTTTKDGRPITFMVWHYLNPHFEEYGWKERKSPFYTDETRLVLESGPYEVDCLYRVTAQKNDRDFWTWTKIEKIETDDQELKGAA